jgi:2-methylcitrate dehydratase
MAEVEIEGPPTAFEAEDGFFAQVSGPLSLEDDADARLPRTLIKLYPAQILTQSMLHMAQGLSRRTGDRAVLIERVAVRSSRQAVDMVGARALGGHALNRETADHSAAFCVAAMLLRGRLSHDDFEPFLRDPEILALMEKVEVLDGGPGKQGYPKRLPADLEIVMKDGSRLFAEAAGPPAVGAREMAAKMNDLWRSDAPRDWRWSCPGEPLPLPRLDQDATRKG